MKAIGMKRKRVSYSSSQLVNIEPLLEASSLPQRVTPQVDDVDLLAWAELNASWIREQLVQHGGLLFRGFQVESIEYFERFMALINPEMLDYKERSSPRKQVAGKVYNSTEYPAEQMIFLHNENSYAHTWPRKIAFYCAVEPTVGGETPIADCRRIYQKIPAEIRARFEEKGILYVRNLGQKMGLPWETVFQTDDRDAVEAYCRQVGYEFEWRPGNVLRTKRVGQATIQHPESGEWSWFNHGTFFHVSTLPQVIQEALLEQFSEEELPNNTYYGDGTPIEPDVSALLRQIYLEEMVMFPWQKGDILLLDNLLTAHARSPFAGDRKILVSMAEPMTKREL